jgi:hypothetical protein
MRWPASYISKGVIRAPAAPKVLPERIARFIIPILTNASPVTFRYNHELDPEGIPQFGLAAEQVEKVNPDLVARDADGKINTVR